MARMGPTIKKALTAFQEANGLKPTGRLDADTWARLTATSDDPVMVEYEIQEADVKGPFNKSIPASLEKKAELKNLNYTSRERKIKFRTVAGERRDSGGDHCADRRVGIDHQLA